MEPGYGLSASLKELVQNISFPGVTTGLIGATFSASIGLAIVMSVAREGKLDESMAISWIFSSFLFAGLATMYVALQTKQPIVIAWSIPGAIIIGKYLAAGGTIYDAAGAYIVISVAVLVLTATGLIKRVIEHIPVPIMLGMVGGVLVSYGIGAFSNGLLNPQVYGLMILVYFLWLSIGSLSRLVPAVVVAAIAGGFLVYYSGLCKSVSISWEVASPVFITPQLDFFSLLALGIPLFFMVVGVQNIQAVGVLQSRGYKPAINTIYTIPSLITFLNAIMCAHTAVTAGPSTAIVSSDAAGKKEYRYIAAFFEGIFWVVIGLMGKVGVELLKLFPGDFMKVLVGLALYDVFISTFHGAFGQRFRYGAVAAFFVASTNVTLLKVGAPFWAIVIGVVVSMLTERDHFGNAAKQEGDEEQAENKEAA